MKVSDYVVRHLAAQGVTHVYELAGGMLAHLLDSFAAIAGAPKLVSCHHEQGAGFAAEGWARAAGIPGVAMATSGPGATNLLTAMGSAYFDSTPMVFITGAVNRNEMKGDRMIRQLGFQETNIVTMAGPVTKWAVRVTDPDTIPEVLATAFRLAMAGRPGPVLLDIPLDVQAQDIKVVEPRPVVHDAPNARTATEAMEWLRYELAKAQRPLVLVGGGVRAACRQHGGLGAVRSALLRIGAPVVNSLMGTDVLGHDHLLRAGMIGSYGNRWANHALAESDFLLVLGSRLDIRQTGADVESFGARRIVQVDIDANEMNNRVKGVTEVHDDVVAFCKALLDTHSAWRWPGGWHQHVEEMRQKWPATAECKASGINPNALMDAIGRSFPGAAAFVIDVGQHQMWAAQSLHFHSNQRFITSGGMGAMGFALPAAIGVAQATGREVVVIAGDGGFQLNVQELETIAHHRLPIKIVVVNNHAHGMVRQFQDSYFHGRRQSTVDGYSAPSFVAIAKAYGIPSRCVATTQDATTELKWLARSPGFALLEVEIDQAANVYPKLAFGKPLTEMEPDAKSNEMEGT